MPQRQQRFYDSHLIIGSQRRRLWKIRMRLGRLFFRLQNYFTFLRKKAQRRPDCFEFNGRAINYYYSLHNHTFRNERCIEIPVMLDYLLDGTCKEILEVGNVLNHYEQFAHDVVDMYEKGPGIVNVDVMDYTPNRLYDLILSISTLEHVGFDDDNYGGTQPDPSDSSAKVLLAYERLKTLLKPNGLLVFTVPVGYNPYLDRQIHDGEFDLSDCYWFIKISDRPEWLQVDRRRANEMPYAIKPFFCHANAIMIGEFRN